MTQQLRSLWRTACITAIGLAVTATASLAARSGSSGANSSSPKAQMPKSANVVSTKKAQAYLNHDLEFIENKGQYVDDKGSADNIKFAATSKGTSVFFTPNKVHYIFQKVDDSKVKEIPRNEEEMAPKVTLKRVEMELVGATTTNIVANEELPGVINYYTANSGANGITGVRTFEKLTYQNVYPNIDMVMISRGKGLKAEFIVRPGGDPSQIKLRYAGTEGVSLSEKGELVVKSDFGTISEDAPFSFTLNNEGGKDVVDITFNVSGDVVTFNVPAYDKSKTLVIDPSRDWATLHGGAGNEQPWGACVEKTIPASNLQNAPRIFITGQTTAQSISGTAFGTTTTVAGGGVDAFLACYNSNGTRNWISYFGGTGNDISYSVDADPTSSYVIAVGSTTSTNDMTAGTGVFQATRNGSTDGFITRFNIANGAREASTYIGSTQTDYCRAVAIESASRIHIGGYTAGATGDTYHGTTGVYQTTYQGGSFNGFVARFGAFSSTAQTRDVSSYYGGTTAGRETAVLCLAVGTGTSANTVFIGGYTNHDDGIASLGSFGVNLNDGNTASTNYDGWVARMSNTLTRDAGTYYGGTGVDQINCIAFDNNNQRIVTVGETDGSTTLVATAGSLNSAYIGGASDGTIASFNVSGGSMLINFGTYFGTTGQDRLRAVAVDNNPTTITGAGDYIVAGEASQVLTYANPLTGFSSYIGGSFDAHHTRLNTSLNTVNLWAMFGTDLNDGAYAIALDQMRNATVIGRTNGSATVTSITNSAYDGAWGHSSQLNNTIPSSAQGTNGGGTSDAFLWKMCDLHVPSAPTFATTQAGTYNATITACQALNASASGANTGSATAVPGHAAQVTTNTYGVALNGALADLRSQVWVRVPNPVAGVTYYLVHTTGATVTGAGTRTLRSVASGTPFLAAGTATATDETAGFLNINVPSAVINSAPFTLGANNVYWLARTQGGCADSSATLNVITLVAQPADNAITQSAPGAAAGISASAPLGNGANSAVANGGAFYACAISTNTYGPLNNVGGNTYSYMTYRRSGTTLVTTGFSFGGVAPNYNIITTNRTTRDTFYIVMRETNPAGCSNDYRATVYVLPLILIENGRSNSEVAANNPGVNPTAVCLNVLPGGTVQSPTTPSPLFAKSPVHNDPYPGSGLTFPTAVYSWTASAFTGWSVAPTVNFSTPTQQTTNINSVTVGAPTSNPATANLNFSETYVSAVGPAAAVIGYGLAINSLPISFYPQPTVTLASVGAGAVSLGTNVITNAVCEGLTYTYNFSVTPASITSGTFSMTLTSTGMANATITGGTNSGITAGSGTNTVTGTFSSNTFSVTVTVPANAVTAGYDNTGSASFTAFSLTNGGAGALGCATTTFTATAPAVANGVVTVVQNPDLVSVSTGTFSAGTNPIAPTQQIVTPAPATTAPSTSTIPSANTATNSTACIYDATNGYTQEYIYAIPEANGATGTANANDFFDWTVVGGTQITADGIGVRQIVVRWTATGAQSISLTQHNNQSGPANAAFPTPLTNACNRVMTPHAVTVNAIPGTPTTTWNNAGFTADDYQCEGTNATLNLTLAGVTGNVQVYAVTTPGAGGVTATTNVATYTPATLPMTQTAMTGGTATYTVPVGTVTATTATNYAAQNINLTYVVVNTTTNCGRIGATGSSNITVFDQLPAVILTPNTPLAGNNPTPVCPNKLAAPNNVVTPPPANPAYTYRVSNTASYPTNPGVRFTWVLTGPGGTPTYVNGTDYTITLSSSNAPVLNNDIATVTFGTNLAAVANVEWRVRAELGAPTGNTSLPAGCQSPNTVSQAVTISATPQPDIAGGGGTALQNTNGSASLILPTGPPSYATNGVCAGQTASYIVVPNPTLGLDPYTIAWSVTGSPTGTTPTTQTDVAVALAAVPTTPFIVTWGNVTTPPLTTPWFLPTPLMTVTVTNAAGCQNSDTNSIYIKPTPNSAITFVPNATNDSACVFNNENAHIRAYTVQKPTNGTTISVAWSITGGIGAIYSYTSTPTHTNDTVRIQWTGAGAAQLTATVTSSNGCTSTSTFDQNIFIPPAPVISGPASVCQNQTASYNVLPNVAGDLYTWDITAASGGTIASGQGTTNITVTWSGTPNTVYALRCTQRSAVGCTTRVTQNVTVNPNPTPAIAPTNAVTICAGQPFTFSTADNTPQNSYAWTASGTSNPTPTSGTQPTFTVTPANAGTLTLNLTETAIATTCQTAVTKTNITVVAAPTTTISRTTAPTSAVGVACVGQSVSYSAAAVGGATYQWLVNSTPIAGETNTTYTRTWNATGTNTLSITVTLGQCSTTVNQTVVVSNPPAPTVTGPITVCRGGATPLLQYTYSTANNVGNTYAWTVPTNAVVVSGAGTNSITVEYPATVALGAGNVSVIETNASGCTGNSTLAVTAVARPNPVVAPASVAVCQNSTGNTYNVTASRVAGSTLNWSVTGGTITNGQNTDIITVTWTTAGNQTVSVTETNGSCVASNATPYTVVVNPAPTAFNVVPANQSVCSGTAYVVGLTGSQTGVNYQLVENGSNVGAVVAGTGSAFSFPSITKTATSTTTFNYTVAATFTGTGCTANMTGSDVVTVNPLPTPSISQSPNPVCAGQNVTFSTAANAGRTYVWTAPAGYTVSGGAGTAAVTYTTTSTTTSGTITVAETITATGCSATATFTSVISASPTVFNVTPATAQVCRPNTGTTSFNVSLSGSQTGTSYQVFNGAAPLGTAVAGTGSAITLPVTVGTGGNITNTGAYTLTVQATGSGACTTPINMNGAVALTVNPTPNPTISGSTTVCQTSTTTYTASNGIGGTYAWALGTVTPGGSFTFSGSTNTPTVNVVASGTATSAVLSLVETVSATGCANTPVSVTITANPKPTPAITGLATPCQGTTQTYTNSNVANTATQNWVVSAGGQIQTGQGSNAVTVLWNTAGNQTVRVVATSSAGCVDSATSTITVSTAPTAYTVATTTATACSNVANNVVITLSGSQSTPTTTYTLFRDGVADGATQTGNGSGLTFTRTVSTVGVYNYTISATNPCTQSMTGSATVTIVAPPTPAITQTPASACAGQNVTFSTPSNSGRSYAWTIPGGGSGYGIVSGQGTATLVVSTTTASTNGTISLIETVTGTGCTATATLTSTIVAPPTVFNVTPANAGVCIGGNITVNLSGSQTGVSYQLFNGTNAQGAAVAGTGSALTFTVATGTGSGQLGVGAYAFTVRGTATSAPCNVSAIVMNGTANVNVNPNPTPSITGPATVCSGQTGIVYSTANNAGSNYTWVVPSGWTVTGGAGSAQITVTAGTAGGNITVQETIAATGCTTTTPNYAVTVTTTPTPAITGNTTVCAGLPTQTYSTTATGNYTWTVTGSANGNITGGQSTNSITVAWANQGTGTVTVQVANGSCVGTGTATVTVNPQPTAFSFSAAQANICAGANAVINLTGSQTGVNYTLSRTGTSTGTAVLAGTGSALQFVQTGLGVGTYSFAISAASTGVPSCTNNMTPASVNVVVNALPTPTVNGANSVCEGSTEVYSVTPVNAGSTYAWTITGQQSFTANANQATIVWGTTAPAGTVAVAETNTNGCIGNSPVFNVTLVDLPIAQTVGISPATICATGGFSGTNSSSVNIGSSEVGYTYNLMQGSTILSTVTGNGNPRTFPALTGLSAGTYTYTVQAITNTTPACTTMMANSVTLTVVANPTPAVTGPTTPCQGQSVTYQTTNNTTSTYAWNIVSGGATGTLTPTNTYQTTVTWTSTGAGSIRVVETNSNGCAQQNILAVNVTSAPTPTITGPANPVCGNSTQTYSTALVSGSTYTWALGSGGTFTTSNSGLNVNTVTIQFANPTPDVPVSTNLSVSVNTGGCVGSTSIPVTINTRAVPTVTGTASACSGQQGSYSTPFVVTGRSYTWTVLNQPPGMSFAPQSGTNLNSINIPWVNTGSSAVTATVEVVETPSNSGNTCTGTSTFNVTVNPLPVVSINGPNAVCQNSNITYTAQFANTPNNTGLTYVWGVTGAQSWSGQGTGAVTVQWGNTNGTVSLNVTNGTGCAATATPVNVTVTPNPVAQIATPPGTVACANSQVAYSVLSPQVGTTYSWTNTGATSVVGASTGNTYTVVWGAAGNGTITLTATTTSPACSASVTRNITIAPLPTPSISGNTTVCPATDIQYTTPFTANNSYQWTFTGFTGGVTTQVTAGSLTGNTVTVRYSNPTTSPNATGTVSVTETTPNNCSATASVTVTVNRAPVPTFATPTTNVCGYIASYDGMVINNSTNYTLTADGTNATSTFIYSLPSGGGTITSAFQGVGLQNITVQWAEPTTAATATRVLRVQQITNSVPSCTTTTDLNVNVNWMPKPAVSGPRTVCSNWQYSANSTTAQMYTPYTYTTPGTNQTINPPASSFAWDVQIGGVSVLTANPATTTAGARITNGTSGQPQIEFFNPGNSPVTMTVRLAETIQYVNGALNPTNAFCTVVDTFNVVVNPIPKPVIAGAATVCGRTAVTYSTPINTGSTYSWVANNGTIPGSATGNSVNVSWADVTTDGNAGFIQVTETVTATGCTTTVRQNTVINHRPVPQITATPTVLCQGTTNGTNIGVLQAVNAVQGNAAYPNRTYTWEIVAPLTGPVSISGVVSNNLGTGDRYTITVNGNTNVAVTGTIRLISTAISSGCRDTATINIQLNPNPTPVITSTTGGLNPNGVCSNSTHTYATTNNAGNTYLWSVAGGVISGANTNNSVTVVWGAPGAGSITVRERVGAMNGTGCFTDVTSPITIQPLPNPDLTEDIPNSINLRNVCAQAVRTYRTPQVGSNTYSWVVTGGTIQGSSTTNQISVLWGAAGAGTVAVTETTPPTVGSCSVTRTANITINPLPTPTINGPAAACIQSTQTYSIANVIAGRTYAWTVTGGTIQGATNNSTMNVLWTVAGPQTVSVTETITATGCFASTSRTIQINNLPVIGITATASPRGDISGTTVTICTGSSVTLAATQGMVSYSWSNGQTTPNITVQQNGQFSVTAIDANGCQGTSPTWTVVVRTSQNPVITASGPTEFCEGESVTLDAGVTATTYRWSNGATTRTINVTRAGFYSVRVEYASGCEGNSNAIEVKVSTKPVVAITANGPLTFCQGSNVVLEAGAGFSTYTWSNGTTTVGNQRSLTVNASGKYTVTVTNSIGCRATSDTSTVVVNPAPTPTITAIRGTLSFCEGDSVTLDAGNFNTYQWTGTGGFTATTRTITVSSSGRFTVRVTDINGCSGSSQEVVVTRFPTPTRPTIARSNNTLSTSTYVSYQWSRNGTDIAGATNQTYVLTQLGTYRVAIVDANGCRNTSDTILVDNLVSVEIGDAIADGMTYYPNPTTGLLNLKLNDVDANNASVIVRNLVGVEVFNTRLENASTGSTTTQVLDLTQLANGTYFIEVVLSNGKRMTGRITKFN